MFGGGPSRAEDGAAYSSTGCPQPSWPGSDKVSGQSPILELTLGPTRPPFSRPAWQAGCAGGDSRSELVREEQEGLGLHGAPSTLSVAAWVGPLLMREWKPRVPELCVSLGHS